MASLKQADTVNSPLRLWRMGVLLTFLLLAFAGLVYRLVFLQVVDSDFLQAQGDARVIRFETLEANRGVITDRHGEPLAVSTPVETIWANPKEILDIELRLQVVEKAVPDYRPLAEMLGLSLKAFRARITENADKEFIYLARKVAPGIGQKVKRLSLPGVYSRRAYKRFYPAAEVAAHVVGFTDIDEKGQEGLELAYNAWLSGVPGKERVIKDRRGYIVDGLGLVDSAVPGKSLRLSLDMRLQYLAYRELKAAVKAHKAKAGSLVMVDVRTGEVLAMVNQPSYNPNNRRKMNVAALRNRVLTDVFEPGSTMKPLTIAAALESGRYHPNTVVDTSPGYMRFGRSTIRDTHNYGALDLSQIIQKSSNVGTARIALELTGDVVWDMFYRMGIGQATGIAYPGERLGMLPNPINWKPVQLATMSYGYGLHVSALQLAQTYMILANGGIKYPLSLLAVEEAPEGEQVFSRDVAEKVRTMMQKVVQKGGTGRRAAIANYSVAGKTGTVHNVGANGYEDSLYTAIFAGIAPASNPRLATVVVVNGPQGEEYYGGEVAAPVFSHVVGDAMRLLNIRPDELDMSVAAGLNVNDQRVGG